MNEIRFLCGCAIPLADKEIVQDEDTVLHVKRIDGFVKTDNEGMLVCGDHGFRRHGWRSLPNATVLDDDGNMVVTNRSDYRFAGKSFVEIEAHFLKSNGIVV